ncbi:MAG TPA: ribonuclease P protein component [Pseudomonadales bacterium]|nr:ribonuclease P protein component [Pseudomonadales bacterium]
MRAERKVANAFRCDAITSEEFPRRYRLNEKHEYDRVLKSRAAVHLRCGCFRVFAMQASESGARLGIIVGKRQLKRAVDRNRVKRAVRESFRVSRDSLPALDVVVQLTSAPGEDFARDVASIWSRVTAADSQGPIGA